MMVIIRSGIVCVEITRRFLCDIGESLMSYREIAGVGDKAKSACFFVQGFNFFDHPFFPDFYTRM